MKEKPTAGPRHRNMRGFIALVGSAVIVACGAEPPEHPPDLSGFITRVEHRSPRAPDGGPDQAAEVRVLVEEHPALDIRDERPGDKTVYSVTDRTQLFVRRPDGVEGADTTALRRCRRVHAWGTGPHMLSYPGQQAAKAIVIERASEAETVACEAALERS